MRSRAPEGDGQIGAGILVFNFHRRLLALGEATAKNEVRGLLSLRSCVDL
jgi:hypothetical protein